MHPASQPVLSTLTNPAPPWGGLTDSVESPSTAWPAGRARPGVRSADGYSSTGLSGEPQMHV
jgi:hypothetical protein